MDDIDTLLPTAKDILKEAAQKEAEKAAEYMKRTAAAEAEKNALFEQLNKPSGMSEEEKIKRAAAVIRRAVNNGLKEVLVYRFPNSLTTDKGRAINQQEPGWENTLQGLPKEMYQLWHDHLRPRGYQIRFMVLEFPGGMPGDIGIILSWG